MKVGGERCVGGARCVRRVRRVPAAARGTRSEARRGYAGGGLLHTSIVARSILREAPVLRLTEMVFGMADES